MTVFLEATAVQGAGTSIWMLVGYIVVIGLLFYFMAIRPQKKQEKENEAENRENP